jgi:hypothetical protein
MTHICSADFTVVLHANFADYQARPEGAPEPRADRTYHVVAIRHTPGGPRGTSVRSAVQDTTDFLVAGDPADGDGDAYAWLPAEAFVFHRGGGR